MARRPKHSVHVIGCLHDEPGVTICTCPGDIVWSTEREKVVPTQPTGMEIIDG